MKYAIGDRLNYIQFDTQFSHEFDMFLSEYVGNNQKKFHIALSVVLQIYMLAGNTGGYFLPASEDDILQQARKFQVGTAELKAIYDVMTRRDVFDRNQYLKNHIITNSSLQITYINAKYRNPSFNMNGKFILDFVYKKFKSDSKSEKIVNKLVEFGYKNESIEQNGIVSNGIEENCKENADDMTIDDFKQKYPDKCTDLPDSWTIPKNVSLSKIANAIERSEKFLKVKPYMTLKKLATTYYQKVCNGRYDDSPYSKCSNDIPKALQVNANILEGIPDEQ